MLPLHTCERQLQRERRSGSDGARDLQGAAEKRRQLAGKRQAQSSASHVLLQTVVDLCELMEDDVQMFARDSDAGIGNRQ